MTHLAFEGRSPPVAGRWLAAPPAFRGEPRRYDPDTETLHLGGASWPACTPTYGNKELRELVYVLTETRNRQPTAAALLDDICSSPLIPADALPAPAEHVTKPPAVERGAGPQLDYDKPAAPRHDLAADAVHRTDSHSVRADVNRRGGRAEQAATIRACRLGARDRDLWTPVSL